MVSADKQLYRSRSNRTIAGVCAGLGEFFSLDTTIIRLVFILGVIFGFGTFAVIYIVMWVIVPEEPAAAPIVPDISNPPSEPPAEG